VAKSPASLGRHAVARRPRDVVPRSLTRHGKPGQKITRAQPAAERVFLMISSKPRCPVRNGFREKDPNLLPRRHFSKHAGWLRRGITKEGEEGRPRFERYRPHTRIEIHTSPMFPAQDTTGAFPTNPRKWPAAGLFSVSKPTTSGGPFKGRRFNFTGADRD